jgi:cytochrome b561
MTIAQSRQAQANRPSGEPRYAGSLIALHWLIGVGIIAMLCIGLYMVGLPKGLALKGTLLNFHKSLGLTIFLFVLIRIATRAARGRPPFPPMQAWQRVAARVTHGLLYVAMAVMPVAGYLGTSFNSYDTRFWGIPLPKWGWDDAGLRHLFFTVHRVTAWVLIALILLHIAATLKHQLIDRDNLLRRMLP